MVPVCHPGNLLTIAATDLTKHLQHGDDIGGCGFVQQWLVAGPWDFTDPGRDSWAPGCDWFTHPDLDPLPAEGG